MVDFGKILLQLRDGLIDLCIPFAQHLQRLEGGGNHPAHMTQGLASSGPGRSWSRGLSRPGASLFGGVDARCKGLVPKKWHGDLESGAKSTCLVRPELPTVHTPTVPRPSPSSLPCDAARGSSDIETIVSFLQFGEGSFSQALPLDTANL